MFLRITFSTISLIVVLFLIYFFSANGLYNSADTPQYFTIRSLLERNSVDISKYSDDPHYYVFPDVFYGEGGQTFGVRGYLVSVFSIPLYVLSNSEKTLTGLFGIFTALGIGYFVAAMKKLGMNRYMSWIIGFTAGFGTYAWKYANLIGRHGIEILLIGICAYLLTKKQSRFQMNMLTAIWAISYGIDISLFVGLSLFMPVYLIYKRGVWKKISVGLIFLGIFLMQIVLNVHWYGQLSSFGTLKQPTVLELVGENDVTRVWFSTPWIPAIRSVLFNIGKLNYDVFENFESLPKQLSEFASVEYAKQYNFYGIFVLSPFLLFSMLAFINLKSTKSTALKVIAFGFIVFWVGILVNAKVLNFWGGNQYDTRYFYPFSLGLIVPAGFAIEKLFLSRRRLLIAFCVLFMVYSMFTGWWGQLSMYKPNLTGERKIWFNSPVDIFKTEYSLTYLLRLTFTNLPVRSTLLE